MRCAPWRCVGRMESTVDRSWYVDFYAWRITQERPKNSLNHRRLSSLSLSLSLISKSPAKAPKEMCSAIITIMKSTNIYCAEWTRNGNYECFRSISISTVGDFCNSCFARTNSRTEVTHRHALRATPPTPLAATYSSTKKYWNPCVWARSLAVSFMGFVRMCRLGLPNFVNIAHLFQIAFVCIYSA